MAAVAEHLAKIGVSAILTMNRGFHAPEFFNDCVIDFQANIDFLVSRGCEEIVILGHSLGGAKCAYFAGEVGHPRVRGVVLMSAIPSSYNFSGKEELVAEARRQIAAGHEHFILPFEDGRTIALDEARNLLHSFENAYQGTTLDAARKIKIPLFSFAAEREWAWFQEVTKGLGGDSQRALVETEIVQGARNHTYSGYEERVAERVANWVQRNLLP
jgi:pimeloyl-ACP methyl ester carboxylesterase